MKERSDRISVSSHSALHVKEVGLDSLVGGDGESCDVVLPCGERLDRALPAHLRMSLSKETIGGEIVDRDRDHEPAVVIVALRERGDLGASRRVLVTLAGRSLSGALPGHIRLR